MPTQFWPQDVYSYTDRAQIPPQICSGLPEQVRSQVAVPRIIGSSAATPQKHCIKEKNRKVRRTEIEWVYRVKAFNISVVEEERVHATCDLTTGVETLYIVPDKSNWQKLLSSAFIAAWCL